MSSHTLKLNKQDEYYTPECAILPIIKFLKPGSTILCPFDTEDSNFVKVFKEQGFNVLHSHISEGKNFFKIRKIRTKVDYIISNPPYSKKTEVFETCKNILESVAAGKSGEEELGAYHHHCQRDIEIGRVGYESLLDAVGKAVQLVGTKYERRNESDEEHDGAEESEDVHRLAAEAAQEPQCDEVEIAVEESVQAELRRAVLACLMVNNLLADFVESGVLGEIGYISVHFAVHLDVLYYILAVGLKSAVEVVQVFDAADFARRGVEELCGNGLRQRVVSLLLVS